MSLRRTIKKLLKENADLREENARLREENAQLRALVKSLMQRVADLEEKLGQNSSNTSKPPSSDPPQAPKKRGKKPSGRKPGGQPGHAGAQRALIPVDQADHVQDIKPTHCGRCNRRLAGEDPHPRRHQHLELPQVKPQVYETRLHTLTCVCGCATAAELPPGIPPGMCGPRLQAVMAMCTGVYRLSKRTTLELLGDLLGVELSLGALDHHEKIVSAALQEPYEEAHQALQAQGQANVDETGWREARKKAWLWVATTAWVTVFMIHKSRGTVAARKLLAAFAGYLVTDRWSGYSFWPLNLRQICWAHLKRDFTWLAERGGKMGEIGEALLAEFDKLFGYWHRVRDGTLARSSFRIYLGPIRRRIESLLETGAVCPDAKARGKCKKILTLQAAMWTFARVEGIEPTNNRAETAIRPAVLWRKGSYGTHSEDGSRFVERIMTVNATLRQHHRDVLAYLTEVCQAKLLGQPATRLLPVAKRMVA